MDRLFTSRTRIELIAQFVMHPEGRYHVRGLEKDIDAYYSAVWRELDNLERAGVVMSEIEAGRRMFQLNPDYPLLDELRGMILKTVGAGDQIRSALAVHEGIQAAFIFGSYAEGAVDAYSDLDLMIIGDIELEELSSTISDLEAALSRTLNVVSFSSEEWETRLATADPFATEVSNSPKLMLLGPEDDL